MSVVVTTMEAVLRSVPMNRDLSSAAAYLGLHWAMMGPAVMVRPYNLHSKISGVSVCCTCDVTLLPKVILFNWIWLAGSKVSGSDQASESDVFILTHACHAN